MTFLPLSFFSLCPRCVLCVVFNEEGRKHGAVPLELIFGFPRSPRDASDGEGHSLLRE